MTTPTDTNNVSTRDRILDAAESLFSIHGFAETSMRDITSDAGVNLAAINYHFGSKEDLVQEVFIRCLDPIDKAFNKEADNLLKESRTSYEALEHFFRVVIKAALDNEQRKKGGGAIFMRLLSRSYSESQNNLRISLVQRYNTTLIKCIRFFRLTLPDLSRAEVFWRIHFMLGSLAFTIAGEREIASIAHRIYQDEMDDDVLLNRLVAFVVAGLQAE
tara:strand:- start:41286 stop:41936 length:651 start_codon:yes stop_codon:yes gene_type:complete